MINDSIEILNVMLQDLLNESLELESKINSNKARIEEIDIFFQSINEIKETDYEIFSPRKAEKKHQNKITEYIEEKKIIEIRNESLYYQRDDIAKKIAKYNQIKNYINKIIKKNDHYRQKINKIDLYVNDIQERERKRIARDLHDSSLQNLTHLTHVMELSSLYIDSDPARAKLECTAAIKKLKSTIEEIRNTIFDLRPMTFDDLEFEDIIRNLVNKQQKKTDLFLNLRFDGYINIKSELKLITIYRIIQECIVNAVKHSFAKEVVINIYPRDNTYFIEISDDGIGFNVDENMQNNNLNKEEKHFGLFILKERIELLEGNLDIKSGKEGTIINIQIPIFDMDKVK